MKVLILLIVLSFHELKMRRGEVDPDDVHLNNFLFSHNVTTF